MLHPIVQILSWAFRSSIQSRTDWTQLSYNPTLSSSRNRDHRPIHYTRSPHLWRWCTTTQTLTGLFAHAIDSSINKEWGTSGHEKKQLIATVGCQPRWCPDGFSYHLCNLLVKHSSWLQRFPHKSFPYYTRANYIRWQTVTKFGCHTCQTVT